MLLTMFAGLGVSRLFPIRCYNTVMNKATYVEERHSITVSKTHFLSKEGVKYYNYPVYWVNDGKGGHIGVAKFRGNHYLMQPTGSPYPEPIPYAESGRSS